MGKTDWGDFAMAKMTLFMDNPSKGTMDQIFLRNHLVFGYTKFLSQNP